MPLFTIVITCYNQRDFIRDAVESALVQALCCREIIVVDDGSCDGSSELLHQYADSIQLVKLAENQGAIEARNRGASLATGDYLVFLDGDDILTPQALNVYERVIRECHPVIICGKLFYFSGEVPKLHCAVDPAVIEYIDYPSFLQKDRPCALSASSFVISKRAFDDVGGWTDGVFHLDLVEMATKLACAGHLLMIFNPDTTFYRLHSANSIRTVLPFLQMARRIMDKERSGEYPGGKEHRFDRYAWLGGVLFFWAKRGIRAGLYKHTCGMVISGWPMILSAVVRRSFAWIKGRRPMEFLAYEP
ncbi:MAG: glycosyltransferase family 2 protein [Puia sp.]|nr:glycosyltransferase family 2 protein [Puia sp.]